MSIEVTFDELTEHIENGLVMDARHEMLPDGEWIRAVRKACKRDDLYVYRHAWTGKFVLCQMLYWEPRVCVELETMEVPPDRGGWVDLEWLRIRCGNQNDYLDRIRDRLKKQKDLKRELKAESMGERDEALDYWGKKKPQLAAGLAMSPYVGEREGGESLERVKSELASMMRMG